MRKMPHRPISLDQPRRRSGDVLRARGASSAIGCAKAGVLSAQSGAGPSVSTEDEAICSTKSVAREFHQKSKIHTTRKK
ncbi:hypothetical protein H920_03404 [Fukomys damarensis]|uniref:Uncharacterized protein n=1 Tax=Fukomys damarensis TaxID=885580 RepID=A0A091DT15_FUKDA|nr:hypothetical protein H920_03404 [Fukomys damarensis]